MYRYFLYFYGMNSINYKGFDLAFKDVDTKKGIVTGYFASFDTLDSHGDVIERGSFQKTIKERGPEGKQLIKWLLDHEKNRAVGKINVLKEDDFGLYYEGKVGRHTLGKDFMFMVEDGIINQHSFGYKTIKESYNKTEKVNRLKELMLYEGSSIQFLGSNSNTPITGIKSLDEAMDEFHRLEKFVRSSTASDETLIKLNNKLISLQKDIEPFLHSQEILKPKDVKDIFTNLRF